MTRHPPDSTRPFRPDPSGDAQWEALARYLTGESSAEEAAEISRRLSSEPEDGRLLERLREVTWQLAAETSASLPVTDVDTEHALARVKARLQGDALVPSTSPSGHERAASVIPLRRNPTWKVAAWRGTAVAAAAMLLLVAGVRLWRARGGAPDDAARGSGTSAGIREFATRVGERDSIRLADGTRILLGPGSTLSVPSGYGTSHRQVVLRGEAYVDVVHGGPPFLVRVGAATIHDVGTKFTIHGDGNSAVRVVVTEGAVTIRPTAAVADSGTLLRAGDVGVLTGGGTVVAERGSATDDDLAWTLGRLVFRDASMAEVRADLRRWYGIELVFADSALLTRHFSNEFVNDTPARVLQVIGMTLGVPVATRGDTAVIGAAPEATRRK